MTRFSIWSLMPSPCRPPTAFIARKQLEGRREALAVERDGDAARELDGELLGLDRDVASPVGDAHDRVDDAHAAIEALEVLGLVRRAEHVGVGGVRLLGRHRVRQADRREVLAHLLAAAERVDERAIEPRLVDLERRVDEDAVAEEALDVVALVRAAVGEDVHAVLAHRADDRGRRDRAAERASC